MSSQAIDRPYLDHQPEQAKALRRPGLSARPVTPVLTVEEIVANVAAVYSVTTGEIWGRGHDRPIAKARHEVWRRMRADLGWSFPMIGKRFGVQHSTVMRALGAPRGAERRTSASAATPQGTASLGGGSALSLLVPESEAKPQQSPAGRETESEPARDSLDAGTRRAERSRDWTREMPTDEQAAGYPEARHSVVPALEGCQINSTFEDNRKGDLDVGQD